MLFFWNARIISSKVDDFVETHLLASCGCLPCLLAHIAVLSTRKVYKIADGKAQLALLNTTIIENSYKSCHELVQAYNPKFRQPRIPHAKPTGMPHVWYHAHRHEQRKRVT